MEPSRVLLLDTASHGGGSGGEAARVPPAMVHAMVMAMVMAMGSVAQGHPEMLRVTFASTFVATTVVLPYFRSFLWL